MSPLLRTLLFLLPFGLDTLGLALGLGIKSPPFAQAEQKRGLPSWLGSALLFSVAETVMPLLGIVLGSVAALVVSSVISLVGPIILIGVGLWELIEEGRERLKKRKRRVNNRITQDREDLKVEQQSRPLWLRQLLLALSISLDELAIGFSLGGLAGGRASNVQLNPFWFCVFVGIQSFIVTGIGLWAGRLLRTQLKPVREWSETLAALLLIGLGVWLFFV